jgi:hypothetical protein
MISTITYSGQELGECRASTIVLTDGTRLNAWYLPKSYKLDHVNSLPRDPNDRDHNRTKYRHRDLDSKWGKALQAEFTAHARAHESAAIQAIDDAKAAKEQERLAQVQAENEAKIAEIADVIRQRLRKHVDVISMGLATGIDEAAREIHQRWSGGM